MQAQHFYLKWNSVEITPGLQKNQIQMQSKGTTSSQSFKNSSNRAPRVRAHKPKLQHKRSKTTKEAKRNED